MKRFGTLALATAAIALLAVSASAQRDEGPRGPEDRRDSSRDGERRRPRDPRPPAPPLVMALDADKDGEISAEEIQNAAAALKTLDKNGDDKLSGDEIHPPRPRFRGRRDRRGPGGPPDAAAFIDRLLENDENNDGKLTKDEAPGRMQEHFGHIDENSDGFIDKAELEEMAKRFRERRPGRHRDSGDGPPRRPRRGGDNPAGEKESGPDA